MRTPIIADECGDGYHAACPGGPAVQGQIGILCECTCHVEKTLRTGKVVHVAERPKTGIALYQLLQWKCAIGLEAKGMRHSSGRSVRAHACRMIGLPLMTPAAQVVERIETLVRDARAAEQG